MSDENIQNTDPTLTNLDRPPTLVRQGRTVFEGDKAVLFKAMSKAQKAFGTIVKDIKAGDGGKYGYNYADLAATLEGTRDALNDAGFCVMQPPFLDPEAGTITIETILGHESGGSITCTATFHSDPTQTNIWQGLGSALSYCRRYVLQSLLAVAAEKAEDNDGKTAASPLTPRTRQEPPKPPSQPKAPPKPPKAVQEPPKPSIAHDADGVVGEDSPEAQAAQDETPEAPREGEDRSYLEDDQVRNALKVALQKSGLTTPQIKRYAHETFGVNPNRFSEMTIAQARVTIEWLNKEAGK